MPIRGIDDAISMDQLIQLYTTWAGQAPTHVEKLAGAGSNRQYFRLTGADGQTVIGVLGTSHDEDHAFVYLDRHFMQRKLPVPRVLAVSSDEMCYLQTDLGSTSLFDAIRGGREAGGRYNLAEKELLKRTIRQLPNLQIRGAIGLDWNNCYPQPEFDEDNVLFDLNYFKYCFLKPTELEFHEVKLQARDFQARNIMLDAEGNPFFIDFQGGRKGPYYYDLASFLWQASAKYSFKLRRDLIAEYYHALSHYIEVSSVRHFAGRLSLFVLFRTLQVLGAYGFRGYFEHKQHFIDSIPPAIQNLRDLLALREDVLPYPYLREVLTALVNLPQFAPKKDEMQPIHKTDCPHSRNTMARDRLSCACTASPIRKESQRIRRAMVAAMSSTAVPRTTPDDMNPIKS